MKKIFMLLVTCVAMVFVSCSKDDENDNVRGANGEKLVSKIVYTHKEEKGDTWKEVYTFSYDKQGRIIQETGDIEKEEYYTSTYTYTDEKIICYTEGIDRCDNKPYTNESTYLLNSDGLSVYSNEKYKGENDEITTYTYNTNNQLINIKSNYEDFKITWEDGNITKEEGSDFYENRVYTYSYNNNENKTAGLNFYDCSILCNSLFSFGYFGTKNKNLILSSQYYNYEYEFDKDGYVTVMKAIDKTETLEVTATIEYK